MQTLKSNLIAIGTVGILAVIGTLMNSPHAAVQGASGGPTVTIDPTQLPLHVVGSTTVSGPVTVTGNVGITGTAAVRDVDQKDRNPYQHTVVFNETGGLNNNADFPAVPAGNRLVITYVSALFTLASGGSVPSISLLWNDNVFGVNANLPATSIGLNTYIASGPVTFYVDAGNVPTVLVNGQFLSTSNTAVVTVTGYLVSVP